MHTDWSKAESRDLLYRAMRDKLRFLVKESGRRRYYDRPDSWIEFIDSNKIGVWSRWERKKSKSSLWNICDDPDWVGLRYAYADHVWIMSPIMEVAKEEDWGYDADYCHVLFVPRELAENMITALFLGSAGAV